MPTPGTPINNEQFQAQTIAMTPNMTLSIVIGSSTSAREDYMMNAVTIEWPIGAYGQTLSSRPSALAPRCSGRRACRDRKEFVHFLVGEGWLAHYSTSPASACCAAGAAAEPPFWLDPGDRDGLARPCSS